MRDIVIIQTKNLLLSGEKSQVLNRYCESKALCQVTTLHIVNKIYHVSKT